MSVKAILFDFIGTTVIEKDSAVINDCFRQAFEDHSIPLDPSVLKSHRGRDKVAMIEEILKSANANPKLSPVVFRSFKIHFEDRLDDFTENEGLSQTIATLRQRKVKLGIGTGLPKDIFQKILEHLRWERYGFDYVNTAEEIGRGRPHPDMIIDMMVRLHLNNFEFLKVGDTAADIEEGKNANVMTAAILSGTQDESLLREKQPDYVIHKLADLLLIP